MKILGSSTQMQVLWFTQNRPDDISVGRRLIAEHLREDGLDVEQVRATPQNAFRYFAAGRNFDLVVGTIHAGALVAWVISRIHRLPLIVDNIDPFEQFQSKAPSAVWRPVRWFENHALHDADHVLFVYESERDRVRRLSTEYSQTEFGVDYERFATPEASVMSVATDRLAELESRKYTAVYLGGLNENYNVKAMVEAFESLPDWRLIILGAGALEEYVAEMDRHLENVHFLGQVPHEHVPGYLHASDVGLCLVDDARTLKTLEYMSAGLPVVHLDGDARERYGDLLTYCQPNASSVADAIDRSVSGVQSDRCQSFAKQYSWAEVATTYREAIEEVTHR